MTPPVAGSLFAVFLFVGMMAMLEVGRRLGVARRGKETEGERGSLGTIEGAVFALFGLIMAFTFAGAANRFNEKRMLIVEEVNAIEGAYLCLDMVPAEPRAQIQELFRRYVDTRLSVYRRIPDMNAARQEMARARELREEIWVRAEAASRLPDAHVHAGKVLLPAIIRMIDMGNIRVMSLQLHPPGIIYALLFCLGLICALLAGYRMAIGTHRSWLHILGFTVMTVVIVYSVLEIEYPWSGAIGLRDSQQMLVELRAGMK